MALQQYPDINQRNGCQYATMTLGQPWGDKEEQVRIFPPCQVGRSTYRGPGVVVFVKGAGPSKRWVRMNIAYYDIMPRGGFVAWDDKNQEYAWHEVGTIDVPNATDPDLPKFVPIIRGESEPITAGAGSPKRLRYDDVRRKSLRERFLDWWAGKSSANDGIDFLHQERKAP